MVSDQEKGVSPYELFQELKSIEKELESLSSRMATLRSLKSDVGIQLAKAVCDENSPVKELGVAVIDDVHYQYKIDLTEARVAMFTPIAAVTKENGSTPIAQQGS